MKKVFYIAHSGFAIETDQSVLLFDPKNYEKATQCTFQDIIVR